MEFDLYLQSTKSKNRKNTKKDFKNEMELINFLIQTNKRTQDLRLFSIINGGKANNGEDENKRDNRK